MKPALQELSAPGRGRRRVRSRGALAATVLDPLAWVLLLAGIFDGLSDNWVHAMVLLAAAAAVWRDAWYQARGRPVRPGVPLATRPPPIGWSPTRVLGTVVGLGLLLGYAAVGGGFERYTWPVTVVIVVPGLLVLAVGWRGPVWARPAPGPVGRRSVAVWTSVLVAGGLWELTALLLQPSLQVSSSEHPTLSFLMESVLSSHLGRSITLACWAAVGYWLLVHVPDDARPEPGGAHELP